MTTTPARPTPLDMPNPRLPLAQLPAVAAAMHSALTAAVELGVVRARMTGASWADIGRALGMTKQSAHERFRHLEGGKLAVGYVRDPLTNRRSGYVEDPSYGEASRIVLPPGPSHLARARAAELGDLRELVPVPRQELPA